VVPGYTLVRNEVISKRQKSRVSGLRGGAWRKRNTNQGALLGVSTLGHLRGGERKGERRELVRKKTGHGKKRPHSTDG